MGNWRNHVQDLQNALSNVSFRDAHQKDIDPESGFRLWQQLAWEVRQKRGVIYLIGNGASASMASHFGADLAKNAQVHTQVFSDPALITAISNDMGYENVFVEPLRRRANPEDMLVAISSSGKSPNILLAVELGRTLGMQIVTLSGMAPDNPLRKSGSLNLHIAGRTYGLVETCHAALLHHWMDLVAETPGSLEADRACSSAI